MAEVIHEYAPSCCSILWAVAASTLRDPCCSSSPRMPFSCSSVTWATWSTIATGCMQTTCTMTSAIDCCDLQRCKYTAAAQEQRMATTYDADKLHVRVRSQNLFGQSVSQKKGRSGCQVSQQFCGLALLSWRMFTAHLHTYAPVGTHGHVCLVRSRPLITAGALAHEAACALDSLSMGRTQYGGVQA